MSEALIENPKVLSESEGINLPKVLVSSVVGAVLILPIQSTTNYATYSNARYERSKPVFENNQDQIPDTPATVEDVLVNEQPTTILSETPTILDSFHGERDMINAAKNSDSSILSELFEKQARLEKSANIIGLLLLSTLVVAVIVGFVASWGYSLFLAAPFVAGLGILWSHGIQLNKIDSLKSEIK